MIIDNLEQLSDWVQPDNAGDSGGPSSKPSGKFTMTPAMPCIFNAAGAYPYNNGYFYRNIAGSWDSTTYFVYRLRFMLPTIADLAACQAIEFELQQNVGSRIYNMAWQADIKGSGYWRTFNYSKSIWEPTAISVFIAAGEWTVVEATFLRGGDATLTHLTLSLNGKLTPINITREATAKVESDYFHAAFQLDSGSPAIPYKLILGAMSVELL